MTRSNLIKVSSQGFQGEFAWQGTSDISAWLAVPTALQLKAALGVQRLRDHNHQKLQHAVHILQSAWGNGLAVLGKSHESPSHILTIAFLTHHKNRPLHTLCCYAIPF